MLRIAAVLICLIPICALAQSTASTPNGAMWKRLNKNEKLYMVVGYEEGFKTGIADQSMALLNNGVSASTIRSTPSPHRVRTTYGDLVDGVDACYSDFRNSQLDIGVCINWVKDGISGKSDKVRSDYLQEMRSLYAEHDQQ